MRTASAVLAAQLLLLRAVTAEDEPPSWELATRVTLWSKEGCSDNLGDSSVTTSDLDILQDMVNKDKDPTDTELACSITSWSSDGFDKDSSNGAYTVWLDSSGIETGCALLLYTPDKYTDGSRRDCVKNYRAYDGSEKCTEVKVSQDFAYSYCCGKNCGLAPTTDEAIIGKTPSRKREELPPAEDIFSFTSSGSPKARDITSPKRAAPLDLLNKRQGEECSFKKKEGSVPMKRKYGKFLRVGGYQDCPVTRTDDCEISYEVSWAEMEGTSFSVGAEAGFNLLEIISASVNMETTYEKSDTKTRTWSTKAYISPGFAGYITWEPMIECIEGQLQGDCADALEVETVDTDKEDEVCFIMHNGKGIPDGTFSQSESA